MRGSIDGLASPDPLGRRLPAVYASDDLAGRMLAGYDEVIAPIYATLDNLWAYFTPAHTPPDFLDWLAGWVGAEIASDTALPGRRAAVTRAVASHRGRGTAAGLGEEIFRVFGVRPEIVENGGTSWSAAPGGQLPGSSEIGLTVLVRVTEPETFPVRRLRALVAANRPATVPYTVEVLPEAAPGGVAQGASEA